MMSCMGAQVSLMYCSYVEYISSYYFYAFGPSGDIMLEYLTFLEVAGKIGCFPTTSCAPKYTFRRNIGINSPFSCAINLFSSSSPQGGT